MKDKIIRYEKARQLVKELSDKRSSLISQCEGLDTCEDNHGMVVDIGNTCGVEAWNYMVNSQENQHDEGVGFEESLLDCIYEGEGACCNCREAYNIKHNSLAFAKKEFGAAKRSLSFLGKKLIKEVAE